jgi:hypothetical protein
MNDRNNSKNSITNNVDKFIDLDSRAGIGSVRGLNISTDNVDPILPLSITQILDPLPTYIGKGIGENKYSENRTL